MTNRHPRVDPPARHEQSGEGVCGDSRRVRATTALAELIEKVLVRPAVESADAVNEAHSLGERAASALLDAGDLRAWELTNRVASEITALAQVGWIPPNPPDRMSATPLEHRLPRIADTVGIA